MFSWFAKGELPKSHDLGHNLDEHCVEDTGARRPSALARVRHASFGLPLYPAQHQPENKNMH